MFFSRHENQFSRFIKSIGLIERRRARNIASNSLSQLPISKMMLEAQSLTAFDHPRGGGVLCSNITDVAVTGRSHGGYCAQ